VAEHLAYSGLVVKKKRCRAVISTSDMAKLRREAVAEENFRDTAANDIQQLLKARVRRSDFIEMAFNW